MADYFTNFSLIVPLPDEPAQKYALELADQVGFIQEGEEMPADFPALLTEVVGDWRFETVPESTAGSWGIWLHSNNGGLDAAGAFIQHQLRKLSSEDCVGFEWSNDCSKPRLMPSEAGRPSLRHATSKP